MPYTDDGGWETDNPLFRSLTAAEVEQFEQYARENPAPTDPDRLAICHPVCQMEWSIAESRAQLERDADKDDADGILSETNIGRYLPEGWHYDCYIGPDSEWGFQIIHPDGSYFRLPLRFLNSERKNDVR